MGTVHGVYLKYVGLSAISYACYAYLASGEEQSGQGQGTASEQMGSRLLVENGTHTSFATLPALICGYSAFLNGVIAVLFKLEWGMGLIGKNKTNGQIPLWSYILFFPFHIPTLLYTHIHTRMHQKKVPVASEVLPGWWVGGCYGHEIDKDWCVFFG